MTIEIECKNYLIVETDSREITLEIWPNLPNTDALPLELHQAVEKLIESTLITAGDVGNLGKVLADGIEYDIYVDNVSDLED